ncbi:hypothetical protein Dimus_001255 [Dionaea muscipula]
MRFHPEVRFSEVEDPRRQGSQPPASFLLLPRSPHRNQNQGMVDVVVSLCRCHVVIVANHCRRCYFVVVATLLSSSLIATLLSLIVDLLSLNVVALMNVIDR